MSRLDDIEKRLNARMEEIDRRINGKSDVGGQGTGGGTGSSPGESLRRAMSPLNPEFERWLNNGSRRGVDARCGLIPQPFDFSYLRGCRAPRRALSSFPSRFDLRNTRALTPIRDQNPYGTCWAHATMASIESCLLNRCGEQTDLSENNLANLSGFDFGYNSGGNFYMSEAYLLRWDGPVLEQDDPYGRPDASRPQSPALHIQDVRWIPPMMDAGDTAGIKEAVSTLGAAYVGYKHILNDASVYREDTAAYYLHYQPQTDEGGHAVAIVGWDDAFSASKFATPPPGDGAWIVRNSWGTGWGDGGYFYVSYHDKTFGKLGPSVVFHGVEAVDNYDAVLQYDRLGNVTCIGEGEKATAANVFLAQQDITVEAVGFYALTPNTSYRAEVHVGCPADGPCAASAAGSVSGVSEWPGYLTVKLPAPIAVTKGTRFSVVVELTSPGTANPIAIELAVKGFSSKANAAPGQSYMQISNMGWADLTQLDPTVNFCCKAYVRYGTSGAERSERKFCKKCGKYTWVEHWNDTARCQYCGAWL